MPLTQVHPGISTYFISTEIGAAGKNTDPLHTRVFSEQAFPWGNQVEKRQNDDGQPMECGKGGLGRLRLPNEPCVCKGGKGVASAGDFISSERSRQVFDGGFGGREGELFDGTGWVKWELALSTLEREKKL